MKNSLLILAASLPWSAQAALRPRHSELMARRSFCPHPPWKALLLRCSRRRSIPERSPARPNLDCLRWTPARSCRSIS